MQLSLVALYFSWHFFVLYLRTTSLPRYRKDAILYGVLEALHGRLKPWWT